jgi:excisionase family DNA binding protein
MGTGVRHDAGVDDGWLSVEQAADACGVAYRTVYRMVRRGELAAEKDEGRPYRIRRGDVDAFIKRARIQPGQLASAPPRISPRHRSDGT